MKKLLTLLLFVCLTATMVAEEATPKALKRGLMALNLSASGSSGNLVSWRSRATDNRNYKFKLFRGTATAQTSKLNSGNFIVGKTNFRDTGGNANNYYKLEVYDENNSLVETEVSGKTWTNQNFYIPLGSAPTDPTSGKATYTPNDCSYCDMDGDGEYEIILKWSPSNEKDAASSGTTSPVFIDCVKLDGTRLWRINTGNNMFTSAHTIQFIAWDFDGDGYGELMLKTAPGTIDGQGKYVLLGSDSPTASLKNSNGKQTTGSEYITVFDGRTGANLSTIYYHTKYADETTTFWGDSKQNRSERYLAALAWLDGPDKNPSPIFARGYYSGAKIGAYDWDGKTLSLRWLHRAESASKGTVKYKDGTVKNLTKTVYGDGAHWLSVGDCDGDGKQELVYGSSALDDDGTTLYRTGLGHGDALHLGDFDPDHEGLEVFMSHEKSPYGCDLRDAKTGTILVRKTAGGDTGRGVIGHFDSEVAGAYFQHSASAEVYDWKGAVAIQEMTHGGGALQNNRIYWTGDLADEFYDKSVMETWNADAGAFWRVQVNGGNYTIGNLNNGSKNNPCVLGDLLGDWREEIVTWTGDDANGYQLIINATSYETDYIMPHLMDDLNYRAQVVNQNCCYNQPPHLSYDPITKKTVTRKPLEITPTADNESKKLGKYWDCLYTTYPVKMPDGVTAWGVSGKSTNGDTIKVTKLTTKVIPANCGVIYNSTTPEVKFVPTALSSTQTISTAYIKGSYCDSVLVAPSETKKLYEFRLGSRGLGFYEAEGKMVPGGNGFLMVSGTTSAPAAASYVLGFNSLNPIAELLVGDVDGDGYITMSDANMVVNYYLGLPVEGINLFAADADGDGSITMADANAIVNIYLGQ